MVEGDLKEHQADLFVADRITNNFMKSVDLCPDHKCFISSVQSVTFTTTTDVDESYWQTLIKVSKDAAERYWIPAVRYNGQLFVSPEIREISNGERSYFLG